MRRFVTASLWKKPGRGCFCEGDSLSSSVEHEMNTDRRAGCRCQALEQQRKPGCFREQMAVRGADVRRWNGRESRNVRAENGGDQ